MKKIIALFLTLALILTCFVACGKDEKDEKDGKKSVVGTYTCVLDSSSEALKAIAGEEVAETVSLIDLEVTYTLKLKEDMTCEATTYIDVDAFIDALLDFSCETIAEQYGMSTDEVWDYLAELYGSADVAKEAMLESMEITAEEAEEKLNTTYTGTYELNGDSITVTLGDESDEYVIDGDDLTHTVDGVTVTFKRQ